MKGGVILVVVAVLAIIEATPVKKFKRRYFPEEDDPNRMTGFWYEDENNKLQWEDLTKTPKQGRADATDITLYLYTVNNRGEDGIDGEEIKPNDFGTMTKSKYFDKNRNNMFVIHGWNNHAYSKINLLITSALLATYDMNVFVVDWSGPANEFYTSAKKSVPEIGAALGDFINELMETYKISSSSIYFAGHSLGAHVAGCAGAQMKESAHYIIGLDPAGPLFTLSNTDNRLDTTDADFVEVVHTCGGLLGLGFASSLGHADYYPNGGDSQPGCGIDLAGTCSHGRAYKYLAEAIRTPGAFKSYACDSFKNFENGKCFDNDDSHMGTFINLRDAFGDYYLSTNKKEPFSVSN